MTAIVQNIKKIARHLAKQKGRGIFLSLDILYPFFRRFMCVMSPAA